MADTIKVILKRPFLDPLGHRHRKSEHKDDYRVLPLKFLDLLPKSAKLWDEDGEAEIEPLRAHDLAKLEDMARSRLDKIIERRKTLEALAKGRPVEKPENEKSEDEKPEPKGKK